MWVYKQTAFRGFIQHTEQTVPHSPSKQKVTAWSGGGGSNTESDSMVQGGTLTQ